jgi:hypothetical protein
VNTRLREFCRQNVKGIKNEQIRFCENNVTNTSCLKQHLPDIAVNNNFHSMIATGQLLLLYLSVCLSVMDWP